MSETLLSALTAAGFNARFPVGTPVVYWSGARIGSGKRSRTRTPAWTVGNAHILVSVEGCAGGIALDRVEVIEISEPSPIDSLTLHDLELLRDAVGPRTRDAASAADEDRWLDLFRKLMRIRARLVGQTCRCGHTRGKHDLSAGSTKCLTCQCDAFHVAGDETDGDH